VDHGIPVGQEFLELLSSTIKLFGDSFIKYVELIFELYAPFD